MGDDFKIPDRSRRLKRKAREEPPDMVREMISAQVGSVRTWIESNMDEN